MTDQLGEASALCSGRYELQELIGAGGMCEVYRGLDAQTGQAVAIKILNETASRKEVMVRRFEQEFRSLRSLRHPNIVRAIDFIAAGPAAFMVMELVSGPTLGDLVTLHGRMPEDQAIPILIDVCRGLHYAHERGVIHRDVKPDNILTTEDGGIKIADFGLSKELFAESHLTAPGRMLGTPCFMAPEQLLRANTADVRSDIYAVGATLYELVTGAMPFAGRNLKETVFNTMNGKLRRPRSIVSGLSARTEAAILLAMSRLPEKRPSDLKTFISELTDEHIDLGARENVHVGQGRPGRAIETVDSVDSWEASSGDTMIDGPALDRSPKTPTPSWAGRASSGPFRTAEEKGGNLVSLVFLTAGALLGVLIASAWMAG